MRLLLVLVGSCRKWISIRVSVLDRREVNACLCEHHVGDASATIADVADGRDEVVVDGAIASGGDDDDGDGRSRVSSWWPGSFGVSIRRRRRPPRRPRSRSSKGHLSSWFRVSVQVRPPVVDTSGRARTIIPLRSRPSCRRRTRRRRSIYGSPAGSPQSRKRRSFFFPRSRRPTRFQTWEVWLEGPS
jgi:hypothetical protein